jgi:hypothetical protein
MKLLNSRKTLTFLQHVTEEVSLLGDARYD